MAFCQEFPELLFPWHSRSCVPEVELRADCGFRDPVEPQPGSLQYKGAALFPNLVLQVPAFLFSTASELHTSASMRCWGGTSPLLYYQSNKNKMPGVAFGTVGSAVPPSPQNQALDLILSSCQDCFDHFGVNR